eukprot:1385594-Ditylum_brightwellii.AAC.1
MLTVETEEAFQFTAICFESKEDGNDSLPLLWIHTATNSSNNEESEDDDSSIGTFFSMSSLNYNASDSSTDDDSVGSDTESEYKDKGDEEPLADHRSDSS